MKRTERRHLKDNELASFAAFTMDLYSTKKTQVVAGVVALMLVVAGVTGYSMWRGRTEASAARLLADALLVTEARVGPPINPDAVEPGLSFDTERARAQEALTRFKVAADAYPSTEAGILARYLEASTRMALGFPEQAGLAYQDVIDTAGPTSLYVRMARLGLAEARAQTGQFEQAIATFKELSEQAGPEALPKDAILMQLGRTYREAGQTVEARQTFNRLVAEFPNSPFTVDAQRELEWLETV